MSQCLSEYDIDHVILERGEIANSWKHERWDSLKLLTPNWQTRLPGYAYSGKHPDGYMSIPELTGFLQDYAESISAPVRQHTTVTSVTRSGNYYQVATTRGNWQCESLVIASGACNLAQIPAIAKSAPSSVQMINPMQYRNPEQLQDGGVLVVGASATGLQLAEEIHRSGRPVTLAVGEHVRLPRTYRGKDIQWWMHRLGIFDQRYDEIDDITRGRNLPSPQLIGSSERATLDLNRLTEMGIAIRGRLAGFSQTKAQFSGSLRNVCALADLKMDRLLNTIDQWVSENGLDREIEPPLRYLRTKTEDSPPLLMDFDKDEVKTILWATGYRPDYSWLHIPIFNARGKIRHQGGVIDAPGMYLLGMPLLRRRKSSFIHGAEDDARDLSAHISDYLENLSRSDSLFDPLRPVHIAA
jgi:putative flavoprotein involved in K+ transport